MVLASAALLPCGSVLLIIDWLISSPSKVFLAACPSRQPAQVLLGACAVCLQCLRDHSLAFSTGCNLRKWPEDFVVQKGGQALRCCQKAVALLVGPRQPVEGTWYDQANTQPIFVNAFGLLFDSNRGRLQDLSLKKPSMTLRLPNRLLPLLKKLI